MTKKYALTQKHREQLKPWAERWIKNGMSTAPMSEKDRELCRDAVRRLYTSAGLSPPPAERIVFVPSPFVLCFAGGASAAIWHQRHATAATYAATDAATRAATRAATFGANNMNWWHPSVDGCISATERMAGIFGLQCAKNVWNMWQGGNQWSGYAAYISFFRHVAKLDIDYENWDAWETLASHSGPRIVHKEFCMISDRPEILTIDTENRPHSDTGPFCRWRDGTALYSVHGVRVPFWMIENPELLSAERIMTETNAEVRRVMVERFGMERLLQEANARVVDHDEDNRILYRLDLANDEPISVVSVRNSSPEPDGSVRQYFLRVNPRHTTAKDAIASTFARAAQDYSPLIET